MVIFVHHRMIGHRLAATETLAAAGRFGILRTDSSSHSKTLAALFWVRMCVCVCLYVLFRVSQCVQTLAHSFFSGPDFVTGRVGGGGSAKRIATPERMCPRVAPSLVSGTLRHILCFPCF